MQNASSVYNRVLKKKKKREEEEQQEEEDPELSTNPKPT